MAENGKLSAKQERALVALMGGNGIEQAAELAQVGSRTLHRWLKEDELFKGAYQDARRRAVEQAATSVQAACQEAVNTMLAIMRDAEASHAVRLKAAQGVLDASLKWVELEDVMERLAAVERALALQAGKEQRNGYQATR